MPLKGSRAAQNLPFPVGLSENRKLHRTLKRTYLLTRAGKYAEAIAGYRASIQLTKEAHQLEITQRLLTSLGGCQLHLFQYRDALATLEEARSIRAKSGDAETPAATNLNISSIFLQLGNLDGAEAAAVRGISYLPAAGESKYRAMLLLELGAVKAEQGDLRAAKGLFAQGADAAYDKGDVATAAWGWEFLGTRYLELGMPQEADRALTESFRLETFFNLPRVNSYWQLAMVRASVGDLPTANVLLEGAFRELKRPGNSTAPWNIYGARGRVRMLAGDLAGAVSDLRMAHAMAREWRVGVVSDDATRTNTESGLAERIYASLIEAGNQLSLETGDTGLARETFEASEENRAASLRALAPQENDWRLRLPDHYWELLKQLQTAELQLLSSENPESRAQVTQVKNEMERMEATAGSPARLEEPAALERTQRVLSGDSVLMSFHLGEKCSWLWAVTRDRFAIYRLPAKSALGPEIRRFEQDLRGDSGDAMREGQELYGALFGQVAAPFTEKKHWLLALDEELFALPFAALRTGSRYLAEGHTLQITSGALMLTAPKQELAGTFLGIGDPIYNHADERIARREPGLLRLANWKAPSSAEPAFARLWGTGQEIRAAAREWGAPKSVLLTGAQATKARVWKEIEAQPAVIHFATHILDARESLHTGWIALSLGPGGQPEFVEPAEIYARRIAARLVVLSGCSSGLAEVRTASGLMGLTRAFLAAGAGGVLATRWPTIDDGGQFVAAFYTHLREQPEAGPAAALEQAQTEAIRSGGWRAHPQFWASYFLTGNEIH